MSTFLVVIPTLGRHTYTAALMPDIARESPIVDVFVIDSAGDYTPTIEAEIARPNAPMTWIQATNYGLAHGFRKGYEHVVVLNNDTRLSPGFFRGLLEAMAPAVGICGPLYDDIWPSQRGAYLGPAAAYTPLPVDRD